MKNQNLGISRLIRASALALAALMSAGSVSAASPTWIYEGTTFAKVFWQDGTSTEDPQSYFSLTAPIGSNSVVSFADGHALSTLAGLSASSFAVGTAGDHLAQAAGRADNLLSGLDAGQYQISFDYMIAAQTTSIAQGTAEVGYETPGGRVSISAEGSGHYSMLVTLDSAIGFYAFSDALTADGTAQTGASLSNISVTPVPEPSEAVLMGAGMVLLVAWCQKKARRAGC